MIEFLEWDSSFFDRRIGLCDLDIGFVNLDDAHQYDLIYVMTEGNNLVSIENFETNFTETKVVFSKKIINSDVISINENILKINENSDFKDSIYTLAFESGKYSRFKLDSKFKTKEFEKLYETWVDNSFNKEFADVVLVYRLHNSCIGFVTYKIFEDYAAIGLLAVSVEQQGKGIGKKLVEAVEQQLIFDSIEELRIPTQLENAVACAFYTKLGYVKIQSKIIKHYWKK